MINIFRRKLHLTHALSGKRIGIIRKEIVVVFEVEDTVQKIDGKKDVLVKGYTGITVKEGSWYPVKESYDTIMFLI